MALHSNIHRIFVGIARLSSHQQRRQLSLSSHRQWSLDFAKRAPASLESSEKWEIHASVCLERKPVVTKEMTPLEKKYAKFLAEYELENSHKSDHEVRHINDTLLLEKIRKGEVDSGSVETAQDFEDKANAELAEFTPSSRRTEADEKNDRKSLNRALDAHLVFVVEQKLGDGYRWICPQLRVEPNETLRQTADRILTDVCPNISAKVMGNAPFGYYRYRYPEGTKNEAGEEVSGAKVFFYKANYVKGKLETLNTIPKHVQVKDFLWLQREELKATLPEKYHRRISEFLIPEEAYL